MEFFILDHMVTYIHPIYEQSSQTNKSRGRSINKSQASNPKGANNLFGAPTFLQSAQILFLASGGGGNGHHVSSTINWSVERIGAHSIYRTLRFQKRKNERGSCGPFRCCCCTRSSVYQSHTIGQQQQQQHRQHQQQQQQRQQH